MSSAPPASKTKPVYGKTDFSQVIQRIPSLETLAYTLEIGKLSVELNAEVCSVLRSLASPVLVQRVKG
jgi:hypothetical protein